jgi:glycerate dehydrogenase
MKFNKLLMLDFNENSFDKQYLDRLNKVCEQKIMIPRDSPEIQNHLDADGILVNFLPIVDKGRIDSMKNLKYIGIMATGYGRIDHEHARTTNIPVCNIPGYSTESVAEFGFAVILEHLRDLERGKQQVRQGSYSEEGFSGIELKGKTFGVIGLGNIGKRIAEIALGFGCDVRYWSKHRKEEYETKGIKYQDIDQLIHECDIVSLNLALNKETENFLDSERMNKMKTGAIILNLAPMELIDIEVLKQRISKGDLSIIIDHTDEMKPELCKELSNHKNCVLYPPIAYVSKEAAVNKQEIFISNLEKFLSGSPQNVVNKQ